MALRLNQMVVRGMIDNREKGKVSGELWLAGQGAPIGFELVGNCDRDLAGRLVEFTNRKPEPTAMLRMLTDQVGEAGTITAARKVRVIPEDIHLDDLTQEDLKDLDWTSLLYLEWFSRSDGRIVVEIVDPELRVSEPSWEFAADEETKMQEMAAPPPAGFIHTSRTASVQESLPSSRLANKAGLRTLTESNRHCWTLPLVLYTRNGKSHQKTPQ